eukprot:scaffold1415_cov117-Isochrysis_galbana.AAC.10
MRARLSEAGLQFLPIRVFDTATRGLPRCSRVLGLCPLAASAWCIVPAPARSFARTYAFYAHHAPLPFVPGARACVVASSRCSVRMPRVAPRSLCSRYIARYARYAAYGAYAARARAPPSLSSLDSLAGLFWDMAFWCRLEGRVFGDEVVDVCTCDVEELQGPFLQVVAVGCGVVSVLWGGAGGRVEDFAF